MESQIVYKKNEDGHYECVYCGVVKKNQNTMHYHMKKHSGILPHKCKHCDKTFLQKKSLDLHIQSKHPHTLISVDEHACPSTDCSFQSRTTANLQIHYMRIHCKDLCAFTMKNCVVECANCGTDFASKSSFFYHMIYCNPPDKSNKSYNGFQKIRDGEVLVLKN